MTPNIEPLADLRIVEVAGTHSSAALCGRLLADLGADVVMMEQSEREHSRLTGVRPPGGDHSYLFEFASAGKRSVLLDLADGVAAKTLIRESLGLADVALFDREGLEMVHALGIDQETLCEEFPHLIVCCITPFGLTGPLSNVPATETTLQAVAGPMLANGYSENPPVKAGIPIAKSGGAILGALAVMAALYERTQSGSGQLIDLGQFDALLTLQGTLLPSYFITGKPFARIGNRHAMAAPWNAFKASDGWIVLCTMGQSQWKFLSKLIGHPEFLDDERFLDAELRVRNIVELDAYIEQWTAQRTTDEVVRALDEGAIPVGPILRLDEVLNNEHAKARNLCIKEGRRVVTGPLIKVGSSSDKIPSPSAKLGSSMTTWPAESRSSWRSIGAKSQPQEVSSTSLGQAPLKDVRILEVGSFTAGPLAGRLLSMLGAEVVKVEPPQGEGSRQLAQRIGSVGYLYFVNNTDKFGCTLDLESEHDRTRFLDLARQSDALITNLSHEIMCRYRLDYEDIKVANPDLIYCAVTGYGLRGPNGGRKAFDTVIQATSGIMTLTGFPSEPPLKIAMSVADVLGGCLGAAGVVASLLRRLREGGGELIDTSMHDVAVWATQDAWPKLLAGLEVPSRRGNKDFRNCPNECYMATDRPIVISVETDRQWAALVELVGRHDLLNESGFETSESRMGHSEEIDVIIQKWVSKMDSKTVIDLCWKAGVPAAIPAELGEVVNSQQTSNRKMILTLNHSLLGPIKVIGSPFKFSRSYTGVRHLAPELGEHNGKYFHD